jgi:hypothetical protein
MGQGRFPVDFISDSKLEPFGKGKVFLYARGALNNEMGEHLQNHFLILQSCQSSLCSRTPRHNNKE